MINKDKITIFFIMHLMLFFYNISNANISLSELQHGVFSENTYFPKEDLVVSSGKTLTFKPGSKLIFSKSHSLNVYGKLILKGLPENPIILTSDLDSIWNGISVIDNGKIIFENVYIQNCVVGISVPDSQSILTINNIYFKKCKKDIRIGEEFIAVDNLKQPYTLKKYETILGSISSEKSVYKPDLLSQIKKDPLYPKYQKKERSPWLIVGRNVLVSASVASAVVWGVYSKKANDSKNKYKNETSRNPKHYRLKSDEYKKQSNIGKIATFVTVPITIFSFVINNKMFTKGRSK